MNDSARLREAVKQAEIVAENIEGMPRALLENAATDLEIVADALELAEEGA